MAWTILSYSFGSLLTATKMTQLYDNLTAIANGDTGAPKVQTAGIADNAVTTIKISDGAITTAKLDASLIPLSKLKLASGGWIGTMSGGALTSLTMNAHGHTPATGSSNDTFIVWFFEGVTGSNALTEANAGYGVGVPSTGLRVVGINKDASGRTGHITWDYHVN